MAEDSAAANSANLRNYNKMRKRFKSMNCIVHYRSTVSPPTSMEGAALCEKYEQEVIGATGNLFIDRKLDINFYEMAFDSFKALGILPKDSTIQSFLRTSTYSLRGLHIIALGILGITRSVDEHPSGSPEFSAWRAVSVAEKFGTNDSRSSIMLGARDDTENTPDKDKSGKKQP